MYESCVALLESRGVTLQDIAECVLFLQLKYVPDLTMGVALAVVSDVLNKREVQHAVKTGIFLDIAADTRMEDFPRLRDIIVHDEGLYGVDEVLAYGICNLYGSIALTNYGYIDKVKPLIIGTLNEKGGQCNTFLDDIVGAIAAAAASKIAHSR
ncbi:MAG: phosphatidylglycerophosphatase A family protein [Erysipelotrichaceae bacterium]